jgi:hypothetical protein
MSTDAITSRQRTRSRTRPRAGPVVGFAVLGALPMAWALRAHARFLPSGTIPQPIGGGHGHGQMTTPPDPITGVPAANYPGLVFLGVYCLLALVAAVACWVVRVSRRLRGGADGVGAGLAFAAAFAMVTAVTTPVVGALSLGPAISFANTIAAAAVVAQYAFVLAIVGVAVFGVP